MVDRKVELSQKQCACVLCNSFFCTFERESAEVKWEVRKTPSINMDDLYTCIRQPDAKAEKLKMFLNYFKRIYEKSI